MNDRPVFVRKGESLMVFVGVTDSREIQDAGRKIIDTYAQPGNPVVVIGSPAMRPVVLSRSDLEDALEPAHA